MSWAVRGPAPPYALAGEGGGFTRQLTTQGNSLCCTCQDSMYTEVLARQMSGNRRRSRTDYLLYRILLLQSEQRAGFTSQRREVVSGWC